MQALKKIYILKMINKNSRILITGHHGMVGSACIRALKRNGYQNLLGVSSNDLDLKNQVEVDKLFKKEKPVAVINAAARVGGILANDTYPYEFLLDNMLIQNNMIRYSHENNVLKFIFLGSSCIYPKLAPQPLKEEYLLTNSLEDTNQWYAIAKISGIKLIEALNKEYGRNYISLMPTNLYGSNDNFDLDSSHVLPAIIRKFEEAKLNGNSPVILWGDGTPMREFLHVDDLAEAVLFALENTFDEQIYNVGSGNEISIYQLALLIKNIVGHKGEIIWDKSKPNGTPRKLLDSSKLITKGWEPKINLEIGIKETYNWYKSTFN
jgi:GDP-L-fucose synthase